MVIVISKLHLFREIQCALGRRSPITGITSSNSARSLNIY